MIVIPKLEKDLRFLDAYCPIFILYVDYKILSKILANRLGKIAHHYINKDQTRFIKQRYFRENIRKVLNIIDIAKAEKISRLLLYVDAEKAFDRLEWKYLLSVLQKFAIGRTFCNWIQLLY